MSMSALKKQTLYLLIIRQSVSSPETRAHRITASIKHERRHVRIRHRRGAATSGASAARIKRAIARRPSLAGPVSIYRNRAWLAVNKLSTHRDVTIAHALRRKHRRAYHRPISSSPIFTKRRARHRDGVAFAATSRRASACVMRVIIIRHFTSRRAAARTRQ